MKYDLLHLPGPPINGCGQYYVSPELGEAHTRGDRIQLRCTYCNAYGEHEVCGRLEGLA